MWFLIKRSIKKKFVWEFIIVIALMIIQTTLDIIIPLLFTSINNALIDYSNQIGTSPIDGYIINGYHYADLQQGVINYSLICSALMLTACVLEIITGFISVWIGTKLGAKIAAEIRLNLYRKIQGLSFADLDKFKTSSLITRLTTDIQAIQEALMFIFRIGFRAIFLFIGGIIGTIIVVVINDTGAVWSIPTLVTLTSVGLFVTLSFILVASIKWYKLSKYATDDVNSVMRENILGVRVTKSFNLHNDQIERFDIVNKKMWKITQKAFIISMWMFPIINFVTSASIVAIVWTGAASSSITIANVGTLMSISGLILLGMFLLISVILEIGIALGSSYRVKEVLQHQTSITYNENGKTITEPMIEFKNVNFKYNETGEYVLKDINLKIEPNQTVGIIGGTGSGKSTLISLIMRSYDVKEGQVLISGNDIKEISNTDLRNSISISPQQAILFSGTIASNLKFGKNDATEQEMIEACEGAQAYEFVQLKEAGFNSVVEQRGRNFSGGQKQRLSIARALIKKPKILILDSSTSALDMITEKKVNEFIKNTNKNRTTISISQRISGVKDADRILVLEHGRIVGDGKHLDLLKNCKEYYEIALSQMGEEGVRSELEQQQ